MTIQHIFRLLLHAIKGSLDCDRFGIAPGTPLQNAAIITFHAHTWLADERPRHEILADPRILIVSWSVVEARSLKSADEIKAVQVAKADFLVAENSMYHNKHANGWPPVNLTCLRA